MNSFIKNILFLTVLFTFQDQGAAENSAGSLNMVRRPLSLSVTESEVPRAEFEIGCGEVVLGIVVQLIPQTIGDSKIALGALVRRPVERCASHPTRVDLKVPFFKTAHLSSSSLISIDHEAAYLHEPLHAGFLGSKQKVASLRSNVCSGNNFIAFLWGAHPSYLDVAAVSTAKSLSKLRQNCSKTTSFSGNLNFLSKDFSQKLRSWQKPIDPWSLVELRVKPVKSVFKSKDGRLSAALSVDCHERILGAVFAGSELREIGVLVSRFVNHRPSLCGSGSSIESKVVWYHLPKHLKVDLVQKFFPIDKENLGVWGQRVLVEQPSNIQVIGHARRIRLSSSPYSPPNRNGPLFGVVIMEDLVGGVAAGFLMKPSDAFDPAAFDTQRQLRVDVPLMVAKSSWNQTNLRFEGLKINAAYF